MTKGFFYVVWGDSIKPLLARSVESVRRFYPDVPIFYHWCDGSLGLRHKVEMGVRSPFDLTLYLDADCVLLSPMDYVFDKAEQFGIACTIAECPWLRWYGDDSDDIEYSSGVVAFNKRNPLVSEALEDWAKDDGSNAKSRWRDGTESKTTFNDIKGAMRGLDYDDQASFSRALARHCVNPFVLPNNWNFHPGKIWDRAFLPIKVWHSPAPVPGWVVETSANIEKGRWPVEFARISEC